MTFFFMFTKARRFVVPFTVSAFIASCTRARGLISVSTGTRGFSTLFTGARKFIPVFTGHRRFITMVSEVDERETEKIQITLAKTWNKNEQQDAKNNAIL